MDEKQLHILRLLIEGRDSYKALPIIETNPIVRARLEGRESGMKILVDTVLTVLGVTEEEIIEATHA